jgi:hypothetical protein
VLVGALCLVWVFGVGVVLCGMLVWIVVTNDQRDFQVVTSLGEGVGGETSCVSAFLGFFQLSSWRGASASESFLCVLILFHVVAFKSLRLTLFLFVTMQKFSEFCEDKATQT